MDLLRRGAGWVRGVDRAASLGDLARQERAAFLFPPAWLVWRPPARGRVAREGTLMRRVPMRTACSPEPSDVSHSGAAVGLPRPMLVLAPRPRQWHAAPRQSGPRRGAPVSGG